MEIQDMSVFIKRLEDSFMTDYRKILEGLPEKEKLEIVFLALSSLMAKSLAYLETTCNTPADSFIKAFNENIDIMINEAKLVGISGKGVH